VFYGGRLLAETEVSSTLHARAAPAAA